MEGRGRQRKVGREGAREGVQKVGRVRGEEEGTTKTQVVELYPQPLWVCYYNKNMAQNLK